MVAAPKNKPAAKPSALPADLRKWLNDNAIEEIESVVADMTGVARGKILPARKYCEEVGLRLPESVFAQTVNGDYPHHMGVLGEADGDLFLKPDASTVRLLPFAARPSAVIIHDCCDAVGAPVPFAPRQVLRNVLALYAERGWLPQVAPEVEFYLVKPNIDADYPLEPPVGRSGRAESGRQAFSIDAVNEFDSLFEELYACCDAQDINMETLIHESGAAQMEINLLHGDALELADQVFLFKRALRQVAMRHKIYGTFMAAPLEGQPGSALHIHQSIVDKNGRNIFSDADGGESDLFKHFIGGLQKYLPAATALCAPNVNSYRRLAPDEFVSPVNIEWGYDNRTAGLRIPQSEPQSRRIENRICGADVNPYLAIAASLACGYLGMRDSLEPNPPVVEHAGKLPTTLPHTLREAVEELRNCAPLGEVLGPTFVQLYSNVKQHEYNTFLSVISAWEREHLLLNV